MEKTPVKLSVSQKEILAKAKKHAKFRYPEYADDFVQFVALRFLDGTALGWTVGNAWVDFLRMTFGDGRNVYRPHFVELKSQHVAIPFVYDDFTSHLVNLSRDERAVIVLRFKWDFSAKEIAEVLGGEESWVSVIQGRAYEKLGIKDFKQRVVEPGLARKAYRPRKRF